MPLPAPSAFGYAEPFPEAQPAASSSQMPVVSAVADTSLWLSLGLTGAGLAALTGLIAYVAIVNDREHQELRGDLADLDSRKLDAQQALAYIGRFAVPQPATVAYQATRPGTAVGTLPYQPPPVATAYGAPEFVLSSPQLPPASVQGYYSVAPMSAPTAWAPQGSAWAPRGTLGPSLPPSMRPVYGPSLPPGYEYPQAQPSALAPQMSLGPSLPPGYEYPRDAVTQVESTRRAPSAAPVSSRVNRAVTAAMKRSEKAATARSRAATLKGT